MIAALLLCVSPTVDLAAVGDVMLGRYVGRRIEREGASSIFRSCEPELGAADFAVGNLECVLTRHPTTVNKRINLVANPTISADLARAGFDAMSVANNHAYDCGPQGFADTIATLKGAKIRPIGDPTEAATIDIKGIRIAFLAFSDFQANGTVLPPRAERSAFDAIRKAKRSADCVVVLWHWGIELSQKVDPRQRALAHQAATAGADLILGSHPHVLQPVEWIGAKSRRCLVAYSLGNFIFDARPGAEQKTAILHVKLKRSGVIAYSTSPYHIEYGAPMPVGQK